MLQVLESTHEEKVAMYSKLTKKALIEMLISCNTELWNKPPDIVERKLSLEEAIEVGAIASIIADEGRNDMLYINPNIGYVDSSFLIGKWALEFFLNNENANWEKELDEGKGCWDDIIAKYADNKIKEYNEK